MDTDTVAKGAPPQWEERKNIKENETQLSGHKYTHTFHGI